MRTAIIALVAAGFFVGQAYAQGPAGNKRGELPRSGPGLVEIGIDASTWSSNEPTGDGLIPIGGSGQVNGEFTIARRLGIEIGLRAQERFVGPIMAVPNHNNQVGIYQAETGFSDAQGRATWNYDWHVDLRNAYGVARGRSLGDYVLTLEADIADSTLFGFPLPLDLTFGGFIPDDTVLYQSSQNPKFGNPSFDAAAPGTYEFTLVLTPKSFRGPPLKSSITVQVQ